MSHEWPDVLARATTEAGLDEGALTATRNWLSEQLVAHEYAKLAQGGHTIKQVPLKQVFVDLPVTETPGAAPHASRMPFLQTLLDSEPVHLSAVCAAGTPN